MGDPSVAEALAPKRPARPAKGLIRSSVGLSLLRLRFRRAILRCPRITAVTSAVTPVVRVWFELPGIDRELGEIGEVRAECRQGPA